MKRAFLALCGAVVALLFAAFMVPGFWNYVPGPLKTMVPQGVRASLGMPAEPVVATRTAGGNSGARPVPVAIAAAVRKSMPVRVEAIGAVQAIASVIIRPRVDSQITEILFADGAPVKQDDILVKLDSRAIEAQIRQAEATVTLNTANLDLARRTLKRGEDLADANFATKQRIDENRSAVAAAEAQLRANEAALENLKTQLSYYTIRAPISGKASIANLKPGNIAQAAAAASSITTINQIAPIYVSFSLPQSYFPELRDALREGRGSVEARPHGTTKASRGTLTLVDNTMDNATGTIAVRATFPNEDEALWPGAIVNVRVTLREEADVVAAPREAVQMGQRGNFVFVVRDGVAKMQPVTIGRGVDSDVVIKTGLNGGEALIVDGQLLVNDGARVAARGEAVQNNPPAGGPRGPDKAEGSGKPDKGKQGTGPNGG